MKIRQWTKETMPLLLYTHNLCHIDSCETKEPHFEKEFNWGYDGSVSLFPELNGKFQLAMFNLSAVSFSLQIIKSLSRVKLIKDYSIMPINIDIRDTNCIQTGWKYEQHAIYQWQFKMTEYVK